MQIKIFTIPIGTENANLEELNHFLRGLLTVMRCNLVMEFL